MNDDDLNMQEAEELKAVLNEFTAAISSGGWYNDAKAEAKRRVAERQQEGLRARYESEVAKIADVETRLRLRDKYRKLGLRI